MKSIRTKLNTGIRTLLAGCILISLSCTDGVIYHRFCPIPSEEWDRNDTLSFEPLLSDSVTPIEIAIEVRHTDRYPYRNLWIGIGQNLADSSIWQNDRIELQLADSSGNWSGTGNATNLYVYNTTYRTIYPKHSGKRKIQIVPIMKDSTLHHITDIGIRIQKE